MFPLEDFSVCFPKVEIKHWCFLRRKSKGQCFLRRRFEVDTVFLQESLQFLVFYDLKHTGTNSEVSWDIRLLLQWSTEHRKSVGQGASVHYNRIKTNITPRSFCTFRDERKVQIPVHHWASAALWICEPGGHSSPSACGSSGLLWS